MTKREKVALIATAVYMLIMTTGMIVLKNVYHLDYGTPQMVEVLIYFTFVAVTSSLIFYFIFFKGTAFKKVKFNLWILEFAIAALILAFLQIYFGNYKGKDMSLVWQIVATTFMVGIGEEMLFRGIIFNGFKEKRGVYPAILISAAIFGFLHITNIAGGAPIGATLKQMGSAGISGILFAWVFYKTKNIVPTMMYHWVWDMFLILGLYIPVSQTSILLTVQNIFTMVSSFTLLIIIIINIVKSKKEAKKIAA